VIARIKPLGLPAGADAHVAAAAKRIRVYAEGAPQTALGTHETESERVARGRAFGSLTPLLGIGAQISGGALEQLLAGINPATGSAFFGQRQPASEPRGGTEAADDWHDLDAAARTIGVSARYLRRLAEERPTTNVRRGANVTDERLARAIIEFLTGRAVAGKPRAFLLARRSESGSWLVHRSELARYAASRAAANRVMAYDLTLSAPKSASLLWAFGDAHTRSMIAEAFDIAIEAAIAYIERHATFAVVRGQHRPGEGLAVAGYRHDVSRNLDAHLHTHCIIANVTAVAGTGHTPDVWRALDGDVLMRHHLTAGYLAAAAFRRELTARLGVEWSAVHHGVGEIASFPRSLLSHFSTRHRDIEREYAALLSDGFAPGAKTAEVAQESTRAAKRVLADDEASQLQIERLAAYGWRPSQVRALASGAHTPVFVGDREVAALFDELCGPDGLTEHSVHFVRQDAIRAIASRIGDRVSTPTIEELADRVLLDDRIVMSGLQRTGRRHQQPEHRYTTVGLLGAEDSLLTLYRQGQTSLSGIEHAPVDARLREQLLRRWSDHGLSDEQVNAVRDALSSGDLVRVLVGPAGTGKTEAMRAGVDVWQRCGYMVIGTANGGRQAEQLHERLGVSSEVVASWLTRLDNAADPQQVWEPGTVLVVDEATQVATRDAERLLRYAARTNTVIVAIGDPGQLSSVGPGGWFRHLAAGESVPTLREMRRQEGDAMREVRAALTALRSQLPERVDDALRRLEADGRVRVCDDRAELLSRVLDDWYSVRQRARASEPYPSRGRAEPTRMMAAFQRDVELLNRAARVHLAADGTLTGPTVTASEREFRVGDEVVTLTQRGHTIVPDGAPPRAYIRTGTIGTVVGVHADPDHLDRQSLAVEFPGRGVARVRFDYLEHDFGDGRRGALAHAYALTADRAQGSTMSSALAVTTDATSRQALYVMLSRAKHDVAAYVVRRRDLEIDPTDEAWLPVLPDPRTAMERVAARLKASRAERLASDLDPDAWAAHALACQHTLAELTRLRRETRPGDPAGLPAAILRRAEHITEVRVATAARLDPPAPLVARLGTRPTGGASRAAWDRAVGAQAVLDARYPEGRPDQDDPNDVRWHRLRVAAQRMVDGCLADPGIRRCPMAVRDATIGDVAAILAAGVDARVVARELARRGSRSAAALGAQARSLAVAFAVDGRAFLDPAPLTWSDEHEQCEALAIEAQRLSGTAAGVPRREEQSVSPRAAEVG